MQKYDNDNNGAPNITNKDIQLAIAPISISIVIIPLSEISFM